MIVKVSISSLKPGMYITNPGLNPQANRNVYLAEEEVAERQVDELLGGNYTHAYIDTEQGGYFADKPKVKAEIEKLYTLFSEVKYNEEKKRASFDLVIAGLGKAEEQYTRMLSEYKDVIAEVTANSPLDVDLCESLVGRLIDQHDSIGLAMTILQQMKTFGEYFYTHSLNVSVLATAYGKHLNLERDELMILGMAGLFHDIGTIKVPERIMNKPGRLTPSEMFEVQKHPAYGSDLLSRYSSISGEVLRIVNEHHEKYTGGGYPKNKFGDKIGEKSYMVGIVDAYDTVKSDRVYRKGVNAHKAISMIFNSRDESYPTFLVDNFVKYIGVYPIGLIVELKNGQKGVVIEQFPDSLLHPMVRIILDRKNRYCEQVDLNLFELSRKSDDYKIVRCLSNHECRIHLRAYVDRVM